MSAKSPPAIYCYSRTGHTARAARTLAEQSQADIVMIEADRYRTPFFWMVRAIWDVRFQNAPPLRTGNLVPVQRPWIVVAGPIWADQPAGPLRSILSSLASLDLPVGLLLTCGRQKPQTQSMQTCESVLGRPFAACVSIPNSAEGTGDMSALLSAFTAALQGHANKGVA